MRHLIGRVGILLGVMACSSPPPSANAPVRIRWAQDPEALDPLRLSTPQAIEAANLIHCALLQLNYALRTFDPALAEAFPRRQLVGDSLTLLTYRLRPAARWDTGQPVLARDVVFTLKLMACPGLPNESLRMEYAFIKAVAPDAKDARRFTITCAGQAPEYAQASGNYPILSEASLDPTGRLRRFSLAQLQHWPANRAPDTALVALARRYESLSQAVPGCGPYRLTAWNKDQNLTFRRKADWWADQLPAPGPVVLQARPRALRFAIIPNEGTAWLALRRGDIDLYPQVTAAQAEQLLNSDQARRTVSLHTASSHNVVTAGFNTRRPVLADAPTRRALSRLFDAKGLLHATQRGVGVRTVGLINPVDKTRYNDSLELIPFDPAGAAAQLQQAGWRHVAGEWRRPAGNRGGVQHLRLTLRYRADDALFATIALQFWSSAAALDIPVELQPAEAATLNRLLLAGDFDLYLRTLKGNPFVFNFAPILGSQYVGVSNLTGFGTPASDRFLAEVAAATSPRRQRQLLRRFQTLMQRQAPLVPLFVLPTRIAANRELSGVRVTDLKPGYVVTALEWRQLKK
ncbi:ABC transporter substrate-binding protein [Hymenobacter arizonensis]|nr:ABC transporter substrate-binding protein [Hymenobacter arizonensis]